MEQTLGNRIVHHRKRLGLTQDQLAEKLGVTAQAVSKWENDQSCPDIAMLPKLAALFGISIDELLGHTQRRTEVHEAEVVTDPDEEDENEGIHIHNGNWEFKWDSGRRSAVGFACWILLLGALPLIDAIGKTDIGFWSLAWPSALVMMGLFGGRKFSFFRLGCVLLGGWFLLDNVGLIPFELGSEIIWPALVIIFGIGLLADALRKPKKPHFSVTHNGKKVNGIHTSKETVSDYSEDADSFDCSLSFGENTRYVELPRLRQGDISVSFGELTVDLCGCEEIAQNCEIDASCCFGQLNLRVPRKYLVESDTSTAFAAYSVQGQPDPTPAGVIRLDASVSFGEILIKYV
jgi:transcriptional regulator with XRE-family HTH domain